MKTIKGEGEKMKKHKLHLQIKKCDGMQGFAAYIVSNAKTPKTILLNIYGTFLSAEELDIDKKELLVEHLVHEFGHAMQDYFDMELSEEFVEKITASYAEKYGRNSYRKTHGNTNLK